MSDPTGYNSARGEIVTIHCVRAAGAQEVSKIALVFFRQDLGDCECINASAFYLDSTDSSFCGSVI